MTTAAQRFFHLSSATPAAKRLEEAEHYYLAGNLNESLAAAQQAWREHPLEADVFRVLAYLHMARGEYPPAAQAAYQAVALDGDNPASLATLAQVYVTFNNLALAEEALAVATRRFPRDISLQVLAADVHFRRRRPRLGVQLAEAVLAHTPDHPYAHALLGAHYLRRRKYADAVRPMATAVTAYPQRWDYLRDYGIALLFLYQFQPAREVLTRSFHLRPQDPQVRHHLYYALRLTESRSPWYWAVSVFFQRHRWLLWTVHLCGVILLMATPIWTLVALFSDRGGGGVWLPVSLLLLGILIIILTQGGYTKAGRGKRAERYLRRVTGLEA